MSYISLVRLRSGILTGQARSHSPQSVHRPATCIILTTWNMRLSCHLGSGDIPWGHACGPETATALELFPELVKMDRAQRSVPKFSSDYLEFSSKKSIEWYVRTARISKSGVLGDPTRATPEKGKRIWEVMIKNLVALVEDLKNLTLDDIYQKRY